MASNANCTFASQAVAFTSVLLLVAVFHAATLAGENWSRFRGPDGSGVASDASFPAEWTDDDYLWKIDLPGKGHSSPVGWEDKVFVTTGDVATGELTLAAINVADGDMLWTRTFPGSAQPIHAANTYASGTPTVDSQRVYVTWTLDGMLHAAAVDHRGDVVWRRELGPADYKHGIGISPIVIDDVAIIANDHMGESFVVALDRATGDERWRVKRQGGTESYATPLEIVDDAGTKQVVVCSSAEGIAALSLSDGSVQWQLRDVYPARCVSSPFASGELIFTASGEGGNGKSLAAVNPGDAAMREPSVAYELKKSLAQTPTPISIDDKLFVWSDRGVVTCYRTADGEQVWTKRIGGNYYSSPVAVGGNIYCVAADGGVTCIAADDKFELRGRSELGGVTHATPAIHQGKMFLRTESSLACLPAK